MRSYIYVNLFKGRRTKDYYRVGNMCESFDDEITLVPENSQSLIEIPFSMNDMDANVCSCIFDVADREARIHRLRTNLTLSGLNPGSNDILEINTCDRCAQCNLDRDGSNGVYDDISHFSVKIEQRNMEINGSLSIKGRKSRL